VTSYFYGSTNSDPQALLNIKRASAAFFDGQNPCLILDQRVGNVKVKFFVGLLFIWGRKRASCRLSESSVIKLNKARKIVCTKDDPAVYLAEYQKVVA